MTTAIAPAPAPAPAPVKTEFEQFHEHFREFTAASNRCNKLDAQLNTNFEKLVEEKSPDWITNTAAARAAEIAATALLEEHPEWFGDKQSFKTPHGTAAKKKVTSLQIDNELITTRLIMGTYAPEAKSLQKLLGDAADFLHIEIKPNKEALEGLKDDDLAALGIKRVTTESITLKPLSVDLGKSVEAKAKKAAKA
jgi:hypothetical protein